MKAGVNTLISDKIKFQTKNITMTKELIQGGWKMGKMSEGGQKVLTSTYKINVMGI